MEVEQAQRALAANVTAAWQSVGLGELADASGIGQNTIRNMAAGKLPHAATLIRVAEGAGSTVGALIGEAEAAIEDALPGWEQLSDDQQTLLREMIRQLLKVEPLELASLRAAEDDGDYGTASKGD